MDSRQNDDHDDDGAGGDESVPNDIEKLMILVNLMVIIITMVVKRWRKKGQRCKSKWKQRKQR